MSRPHPFILLADDDPNIVDSLAPFLERAGFHVLVVSDGQSAFEKTQSHHPDLIILDVLMPRMDGRETLRRLRQVNLWTPTILLTQVGEASERALALEEGADDYLNKPFDPHELLAGVEWSTLFFFAGLFVVVGGVEHVDREAAEQGRQPHLLPGQPRGARRRVDGDHLESRPLGGQVVEEPRPGEDHQLVLARRLGQRAHQLVGVDAGAGPLAGDGGGVDANAQRSA